MNYAVVNLLSVLLGWEALPRDRWGNDGADSLAVAGARMHRAPPDIFITANQKQHSAVVVPRKMLAVLKARLAAESSATDDA